MGINANIVWEMWNFMLFWKIIDNKYFIDTEKNNETISHFSVYSFVHLFCSLLVTLDRFVYKYMITPGDSRLKRSSDL